MISREDFKLMAVGKYTLGKPSVKSEEYFLFLDGALFAFDKLQAQIKKEESVPDITTKAQTPNELGPSVQLN